MKKKCFIMNNNKRRKTREIEEISIEKEMELIGIFSEMIILQKIIIKSSECKLLSKDEIKPRKKTKFQN